MLFCISCKNKKSTERCQNRPLRGFSFCGKHVKTKVPRIWADVNNVHAQIISIQTLWRGFHVRKFLKLAGNGVLKRSMCHNEEEIVSFDSKESVHPFNYFSFVENDKLYWFDINNIMEICTMDFVPQNPYTRTPFSTETRRRIRAAFMKNRFFYRHHGYPIEHQVIKRPVNEVVAQYWNSVCQVICENNFFDTPPIFFTSLNRTQLYVFISMIHESIAIWSLEHKSTCSRRHRYTWLLRQLLKQFSIYENTARLSVLTASVLTNILTYQHDQYSVCFSIMSAFCRL